MTAPALVIRIEFEGPTLVYADALHESEAIRLDDWLRADSGRLELIERALDIAGERRAA